MELKKCVICGKPYCIKKVGTPRLKDPPIQRPSNSLTCSSQCTKIYNNEYRKDYQKEYSQSEAYKTYQKKYQSTPEYKEKKRQWRRRRLLLFKMY